MREITFKQKNRETGEWEERTGFVDDIPQPPLRIPLPCRFEGDITQECTSCGAIKKLRHVRTCNHDEADWSRCTRGTNGRADPDIHSCAGCDLRDAYKFESVPVGKRHLVYHLYPIGNWRERLKVIINHWEMFETIHIGVAIGDGSASLEEVQREFGDLKATWIVVENDRRIREKTTWAKLWESVLKVAAPEDAILRMHGKSVSRSKDGGNPIWAEVAEKACLDHWQLVELQLQRFPITGPFRALHPPGWVEPANRGMHYSGTYWWVRAGDIATRDWRTVYEKGEGKTQDWWGVESWPGREYHRDETGALFTPEGNLYNFGDRARWDETMPAFREWSQAVQTNPAKHVAEEVFRSSTAARPTKPVERHKLHVVIPCTRPGNLPRVMQSLGPLGELFDLRTHIIHSRGGTHGNPERSEALERITDNGWVYFLDDDNTIHPQFTDAVLKAIRHNPQAVGFVFDQVLTSGRTRLKAKLPRKVGEIDTAQFVFRRGAIGDARWNGTKCCQDFTFAAEVIAANEGRVVVVNEPAAFYNSLRAEYVYPGSIPGWFSGGEAAALADHAKGQMCLEIGRHQGRSLCVMAQVAAHVVSIDLNDGKAARNNLRAWGLEHKVTILTGDSTDLLPRLDGRAFGLVLIDGLHTREQVLLETVLVESLLARGSVVAYHDYGHPKHTGVKPAVDAIVAERGWGFELVDSLAICKASEPVEVK